MTDLLTALKKLSELHHALVAKHRLNCQFDAAASAMLILGDLDALLAAHAGAARSLSADEFEHLALMGMTQDGSLRLGDGAAERVLNHAKRLVAAQPKPTPSASPGLCERLLTEAADFSRQANTWTAEKAWTPTGASLRELSALLREAAAALASPQEDEEKKDEFGGKESK